MRLTPGAYALTCASLIAGVLAQPVAAFAAWDASAAGADSSAAAMVLPAMRAPDVRATGASVQVEWPAFTGPAVRGYRLTRTDAATRRTVAAERGCGGVITKTRCVEQGVPDGIWTYGVVALVGDDWRSAAGAAAPLKIGKPAPATTISVPPTVPGDSAPGDSVPAGPAPDDSAPVDLDTGPVPTGPVSSKPAPSTTAPAAPEPHKPASTVSPAPSAAPTKTPAPDPAPTKSVVPVPETTPSESPKPSLEIPAEATPTPSPAE